MRVHTHIYFTLLVLKLMEAFQSKAYRTFYKEALFYRKYVIMLFILAENSMT